jgi:hypothetical protein
MFKAVGAEAGWRGIIIVNNHWLTVPHVVLRAV